MSTRHRTIALAMTIICSLVTAASAQTLVQQVSVSDDSDRDLISEALNPGPLADIGDIVVRERANLGQDNLQIRTFLEFDLSSLTAEDVVAPDFTATFSVEFVTRLNDVNDMGVLVGRVLDDDVNGGAWSNAAGELPLFEWARPGDEAGENLAADPVILVENIKTDPFGIYTADVTPIVKDWVNGTSENNGFVLFGTGDLFQGAGLNGAQLVVPEPSGLTLVVFGFLGLLWRRSKN